MTKNNAFLIENHYKTIFGSVRMVCSSHTVLDIQPKSNVGFDLWITSSVVCVFNLFTLHLFSVQIPSLKDFDTFKLRACGFYCPQDCELGFPAVLLKEYAQCLKKSRTQGNYSDEQVKEAEEQLQVIKIKATILSFFWI